MRIALVINSLAAGGAERIISLMANYWAERGVAVLLITLEGAESDHYALDSRVERIALNQQYRPQSKGQALRSLIAIVWALRKELTRSRTDCVISFTYSINVLTLLACAGKRIPVIVSERTDPREHPTSALWVWLRRYLYPRAAALVVQTARVREWALTFLDASKVEVIANPVHVPSTAVPESREKGSGERIVAGVGRLTHEKGFDLLLQAFARCANNHPSWRLVIAGDGSEREQLLALSAQLGITNRVSFVGQVKDVARLLADVDLFVLPSRYEGFPNALCEAMALGLAVAAAAVPSGPEIVQDGVNGVLFRPGDVDDMAAAMNRLMSDDGMRRRLGLSAVAVRERFGIDRIMALWTGLLARVGYSGDGTALGARFAGSVLGGRRSPPVELDRTGK